MLSTYNILYNLAFTDGSSYLCKKTPLSSDRRGYLLKHAPDVAATLFHEETTEALVKIQYHSARLPLPQQELPL